MTDDLFPMGVPDRAVAQRTTTESVSSDADLLLSDFLRGMNVDSSVQSTLVLDALVDGLRESKVTDHEANAAALRACVESDEVYLRKCIGNFLWITYFAQPASVVTYDLPLPLDIKCGWFPRICTGAFFGLTYYNSLLPKVVVNRSESYPSLRACAVVNYGRHRQRDAEFTVDFAEKDPPQVTLFSAYIAANTRSILLPGGNWRAPLLLHWEEDAAGSSRLLRSRLRDGAPHLRNTSTQEFPKEGARALRDHLDGIIRAAEENPEEILTTYSTPGRSPAEFLNYKIGELVPSVWDRIPAVPR